MFSKWIDLYRGYDEQRYTELCALLTRYDIKRRAQIARPDSRLAIMAAWGSRFGSFWFEKEAKRDETSQKLYLIRVRSRDEARTRALIQEGGI